MNAVDIMSIIASSISIVTFITLLFSIVSWICNLTRKNTINPNINLIPPHFVKGHGKYIADIDIFFYNKSNRTFYIRDIYIQCNKKRIEIYKRQEAYERVFLQIFPIKVEPYQPITLAGACYVLSSFSFPNQIELKITIGKRTLTYPITPHLLPQR